MVEVELSERVSLALSKVHIRAIDDWRRADPDLPSRSKAIRLMIEAATTRDEPAKAKSSAPR